MRRYRRHKRAAGFQAVTFYEPPPRTVLTSTELDRRIIDARSLALHCIAAQRIESEPRLLQKVRQRIDYWRRNYRDERPPRRLEEWDYILSKPWPAIAVFITDPAPGAARLRRASPFEIILSARERKRVYAAFVP
jgi:hypothetical protein